MLAFVRRELKTIVVAMVTAAITAGGPAIAHGVAHARFAHKAGRARSAATADNAKKVVGLRQGFMTGFDEPYVTPHCEGRLLGEVFLHAGPYAPAGTAKANGRLLPIADNQSLFNLVGTRYGGDGTTNFRIPNMSSIAPAGVSYVICLQGDPPLHPGT